MRTPLSSSFGCTYSYGGFYFVCAMTFHSEFVLLNGTLLGVTFGTGRGGKQLHPIVPFGVSVLAMVTNKIDTVM